MSSSEINLYDGEHQRVPAPQIREEYQKIRSYLDRHFNNEKDILAIQATKDYRYFLVMMSALELGITYIPLMKNYPQERVNQIKSDAHFSALISDETIERILSQESVPHDRINPQARETAIAYTIFTSGSTGKPKGVMISRKALLNFIHAMDEICPDISSKDRLLQISEFSFDLSVSDVALFICKNTHLYFTRFEHNYFKLALELEDLAITTINTVPNNLSALLKDDLFERVNMSALKNYLICGSRFTYSLYQSCSQKLTNSKVYNFYGPTESTVFSHVKKLDFSGQDRRECNVTIGTPLKGVSAMVFQNNKPAQPFQEGELLLAGEQLLTGYMNDPARSQEVLLKHDGITYYRTGDVAFMDEKGDYFIVGRMDDTIKRRGFRINLLDIDSYIHRLPYIEDCACVAIPHETFENQTLAYIKLKENTSVEQIKQDLLTLVPDYQVPDLILFVDTYPVNANGKVCKKTLASKYISKEVNL